MVEEPQKQDKRSKFFSRVSDVLRNRRKVAIVAGGCFLLLGSFLLFGTNAAKKKEVAPKIRAAHVEKVFYEVIAEKRTLVGTLRARIEGDQAFRVAGKLAIRNVQVGDRVKEGDVLASLDATDLRLARESAEADLAVAQSSARQADQELVRVKNLRALGWSTEQTSDKQNAAYGEAVSKLRRAQRQLELAQNAESYSQLRAQNSGTIISVFAEAGQVINAGQAIFRLAMDGEREVEIAVPEQDLERARNAEASAALWSHPGVTWQAALRELSASADPATRTFRARYAVKGLAPDAPLGMTATLTLSNPPEKPLMRLPLSALFDNGLGASVYVLTPEETLLEKRVQVHHYESDVVAIESGVENGSIVVVYGTHTLQKGEKIRPLMKTACAKDACQ